MRYGSMVIAASTLGMIAAVLPIYYFLDQNYRIFTDLAYQYSPGLLEHLERERIWVTSLLFSGFAGLTVFFLFLSFKFTNRIVGPLRVLRNHLRRLSRGCWYMSPVKIRDTDEFHDLIEAYNYFYESWRTHIRRDIELIKQIKIDPESREAYAAWRTLLEEKSMQLNLKTELPFPVITAWSGAKSAESPASRRVS